jgi:hypothetical protein
MGMGLGVEREVVEVLQKLATTTQFFVFLKKNCIGKVPLELDQVT